MLKNNNFEEYAQLEEYVSQEDASRIKSELFTCPEINNSLSGFISELSKNHAKSVLITTPEMVVDDHGLIHSAFVFAAANYVAQAAVNKEFSLLISSKTFFYAPLKLGDVLELEAHALFDESSKKREVKVLGHVKEIKIFEANMQVVVTEEHIFKLKRPPTNNNVKNEESNPNANLNPSSNTANNTFKTP
ncbi:hypothetical protein [Campylobacter sp. CCS1377]|uniref:Thioesterase n=1 Tax=Campylobacter sp. CCS1377 TaxID=3158229 RepID=A0AAU7E820_9BACT|nr:hypothetical protein [Campylobacter jejuni]